ncbi:peptidoglycan recognition protein family protein [Streptomyces sp. MUM 178J]|uniref:peptidoglycan recognition protein family protein n=1 Tax=Streptomyces sp. MUM 178J TaxID=2791991 RepID=UPI001F039E6D|nr:N-acetylmuramoyl-L-alanine amidase [Streptomyces sp. MUM 178J]WRQ81490.1 N-acetylmuramoyl-L-alanine amidase [Streptomyces sp. MUM 178J]
MTQIATPYPDRPDDRDHLACPGRAGCPSCPDHGGYSGHGDSLGRAEYPPCPAPAHHPPRPTRRALLGGAVALGAAGVLPFAAAGQAHAADPVISGCAVWGARPPSEPVKLLPTGPHKIIVHHTATANSADYSKAHSFAFARSVQNHHMDANGWIDTGQHFTVSRGAHILEGRHRSAAALQDGNRQVESSHSTGQNTVAVGIETEGTYTSVEPRTAQYAALVRLCTHICRQYRLRAYQIYGHRDFNQTSCPGDRLYDLLPKLRADVAAAIGGDPAAPVWPLLRSGDSGERVKTLQHLLVGHGASLTPDSAFGPLTETAVRDFQKLKKASVDGIAGRQTWNQLIIPVGRGDTDDAVKAVQSQLVSRGHSIAVDGRFGHATRAALSSFQRGKGLPPDGAADARTWSRLVV